MSSTNGMGPLPENDTIPVQISDTVARGTVKPTYPVIQYPHNRDSGGDAIANGFVYRGKLVPALKDKLVFGDITTGRIWYANRAEVLAADDGNPTTRRADLRDGRRPASTHRRDVPRARRKGRSAPRDGRDGWPRPRRPPIRGRQRRRALHPDQERRHDQESGGRKGRDDRRRPLRTCPLRVPVRTSPTRQPRASEIPWQPRPSRSPPGSGPTTPIARPVTGTWRKGRSKPA